MSDTSGPVARINALTTNARNTWFVLLGVLVFVSITLMGVQHIDFYGVDRATDLPLVNVSVPTWLFFYAAPLLITAVYGYLHLYLLRLWDAMSVADPQVNGRPLGDAIAPWLISDSALHLRMILRKEPQPPATHRMLEGTTMVLNFILVWVFGLFVLCALWTQSMPARAFWMTAIAGFCILASAFVGASSLVMLFKRMRVSGAETDGHIFRTIPRLILIPIAAPLVIGIGYVKTVGIPERYMGMASSFGLNFDSASIDLADAALVEKPAGWLPYEIARLDFLATWCRREGIDDCFDQGDWLDDFDKEWKIRHNAVLSSLKKPGWSAVFAEPPDLRKANLYRAFLPGTKLSGAQLQGANFSEAQMQGADLSDALLQGAKLRQTKMQRINLYKAQMENAALVKAYMQGANLQLVQLEGADLRWAQMQGAKLVQAQLKDADLSESQMHRVDLIAAQMQAARLDRSLLSGTPETPISLENTNLSASTNRAGALRNVDFTGAVLDGDTDWRNVFFDASVTVPPEMRDRIGNPCLWNWIKQNPEPLSDEAFWGHWRGWKTLNPGWTEAYDGYGWRDIAPELFYRAPPIAPPANCTWQTGPIIPPD